jgi:hypothetical protein
VAGIGSKRSGLAALLSLVLGMGAGVAGAKTVVVKAGTKVALELRSPLSTKTAVVGQKVPLFTRTALMVREPRLCLRVRRFGAPSAR